MFVIRRIGLAKFTTIIRAAQQLTLQFVKLMLTERARGFLLCFILPAPHYAAAIHDATANIVSQFNICSGASSELKNNFVDGENSTTSETIAEKRKKTNESRKSLLIILLSHCLACSSVPFFSPCSSCIVHR